MSLLDTIVRSTIRRETTVPSRAGFGTPMFVAMHALWPAVVRQFSSLAAVKAAVTAGGGTNAHPIVEAATVHYSAEVACKNFVVGKRSINSTQIVQLTIKKATVGYVQTFTVRTPDGVDHVIAYTNQIGDTTTTIATAVAALIDALADVVAVGSVAVITATTTAGKLIGYRNLPPISEMGFADTSTGVAIATDLDAILVATKLSNGAISWYGFSVDHGAKTVQEAASVWAEANFCIFVSRCSDSAIADPLVTTDLFSGYVAAARKRTLPMYAQINNQDYRDAGILSRCLSSNVGAVNWAFKTLGGVTVDRITDDESDAARAKKGTTYQTTNNTNLTYEAATPAGEFIDLVVNTDFLNARAAEDLYGFLKAAEIVTFDQKGVDACIGIVQARLDRSTIQPNPILSTDHRPVVDAVAIDDVPLEDKAARRFKSIVWRATFQGAINGAEISGTIGL